MSDSAIPLAAGALAVLLVGFSEGITWIVQPALWVAGVGVVLWLMATRVSIASRTRTVHIHGKDWADAARHEAGHAGVTRAVGGRVTEAVIRPDGTGYAQCVLPRGYTPAQDIAVSLAGGYREGVDPWRAGQCRGDRKLIAAAMGGVPWGERAAVRAEAVQIGRGPGIRSGYAARVESTLLRKGRL